MCEPCRFLAPPCARCAQLNRIGLHCLWLVPWFSVDHGLMFAQRFLHVRYFWQNTVASQRFTVARPTSSTIHAAKSALADGQLFLCSVRGPIVFPCLIPFTARDICIYVCVCERERKRQEEREGERKRGDPGHRSPPRQFPEHPGMCLSSRRTSRWLIRG